MNIGELFRKYGSDKDCLEGGHTYGAAYQKLFGPIRESVRDVLELGVLGGASLRAWRDFFPHASVVGLDNNPTVAAEERIRVYKCDVTKADELDAALGDARFDVVVDDASHWSEDQLTSWKLLWGRVRPGGIYVVEDVQHAETCEAFRARGAEIIDLQYLRPERGWDNVLVVLRKGLEGAQT